MLEALSTYFSTQTISVLAAILIIALSFFLIGNMQRIVRWVLGQRLPQWIGNITLLLQFAVVAGEMAFFVNLLAPGSWKAWLTFAIVAVLALCLIFVKQLRPLVANLSFRTLRPGREHSAIVGSGTVNTGKIDTGRVDTNRVEAATTTAPITNGRVPLTMPTNAAPTTPLRKRPVLGKVTIAPLRRSRL